MKSRSKRTISTVLRFVAMETFVILTFLIVAKVVGGLPMPWVIVWLGCLWIPVSIFVVGFIILSIVRLSLYLEDRVHVKIRSREMNARIRAQAMAYGIWDRPEALGGKALELSAWEHYKIKRKRGETDKELRCRCMIAKADAMERSEQHGA